jgi:methylenetetrahydrofolate reductase (NADPH)
MTRSRFEIMPFARGEAEAASLPRSTHITVTCSPKHGLDHTLEVATRVRRMGHTVTLHLAARMVRDGGHLDELLARIAEARMDDVFVIGGDATPPEGPYASVSEILPLIHEDANRPKTIGIAGYPEGHPLISDVELDAALQKKMPLADYVTTQLCFDPEAVLRFTRLVPLPVIAGVPGIVDRKKLLEISARVGVGPSLRYLRKQGGVRNVLRLSRYSADHLHNELAPHDDAIAGFHYFTFNHLRTTWEWAEARSAISSDRPAAAAQ